MTKLIQQKAPKIFAEFLKYRHYFTFSGLARMTCCISLLEHSIQRYKFVIFTIAQLATSCEIRILNILKKSLCLEIYQSEIRLCRR